MNAVRGDASGDARVAARSRLRSFVAYAVAALTPAVAWLAWISWSGSHASNAMYVLWFVSVAVGCLVAGSMAARRSARMAALTAITIVSTMTTLFLWWSSEDSTGQFGVGILLATPLVIMGAAALVPFGALMGGRLPGRTG